ncbi:BQ5605_C001g00897 [Microbotryum silenes-dioicae]|uniref:BQ5605_C001g00897 protein n=1 Tax=Microbotryum silenes-dioicae TaxID=796604 RepID=A0A2X0M8L7_9BASI|nr:BQ5605_C001g00897 [Microbotryum silenes-dioicae]
MATTRVLTSATVAPPRRVVSSLHPSVMPLRYLLLFPAGEYDFLPKIPLCGSTKLGHPSECSILLLFEFHPPVNLTGSHWLFVKTVLSSCPQFLFPLLCLRKT